MGQTLGQTLGQLKIRHFLSLDSFGSFQGEQSVKLHFF